VVVLQQFGLMPSDEAAVGLVGAMRGKDLAGGLLERPAEPWGVSEDLCRRARKDTS